MKVGATSSAPNQLTSTQEERALATEQFYTESGSSPPLQYFPFATPQLVRIHHDDLDSCYERMALGYWQDISRPGGETQFNIAEGGNGHKGYHVFIPEVQS